MKKLALILVLGIASVAQARFVNDGSRQPILVCRNDMIQAQLLALPNQKDLQLVVQDKRFDSVSNVIYNAVVHPVAAKADFHVFLNAQASLRVGPSGDRMQGVLNLNRNRPSVGLMLECFSYTYAQPVPSIPTLR